MLREIAGGQETRGGSPKQGAHVSLLSIEERYRLWRQTDMVQKMLAPNRSHGDRGEGRELSDQGDAANGGAGEQRIESTTWTSGASLVYPPLGLRG